MDLSIRAQNTCNQPSFKATFAPKSLPRFKAYVMCKEMVSRMCDANLKGRLLTENDLVKARSKAIVVFDELIDSLKELNEDIVMFFDKKDEKLKFKHRFIPVGDKTINVEHKDIWESYDKKDSIIHGTFPTSEKLSMLTLDGLSRLASDIKSNSRTINLSIQNSLLYKLFETAKEKPNSNLKPRIGQIFSYSEKIGEPMNEKDQKWVFNEVDKMKQYGLKDAAKYKDTRGRHDSNKKTLRSMFKPGSRLTVLDDKWAF